MRPAPEGYVWVKTVNEAKMVITNIERMLDIAYPKNLPTIKLIDMSHSAGDCVTYGGNYTKLLDWLKENNYNYPIRIHSMNAVGRENMLRICKKNNWTILD